MDKDRKLISGLKRGDEWAYRRLYDEHYVLLCKVADGFLSDSYLAETVVNDVILSLWENREKIDIKTTPRSYLLGAVRYACLGRMKKDRAEREVSFSMLGNDPLFVESGEFPLGRLLEKELEDKITEAVNRLPRECREVFKLSRFEQLGYEEIARKLSISVNTVKYHIKNALLKLHEDLAKYLILIAAILMNVK